MHSEYELRNNSENYMQEGNNYNKTYNSNINSNNEKDVEIWTPHKHFRKKLCSKKIDWFCYELLLFKYQITNMLPLSIEYSEFISWLINWLNNETDHSK